MKDIVVLSSKWDGQNSNFVVRNKMMINVCIYCGFAGDSALFKVDRSLACSPAQYFNFDGGQGSFYLQSVPKKGKGTLIV